MLRAVPVEALNGDEHGALRPRAVGWVDEGLGQRILRRQVLHGQSTEQLEPYSLCVVHHDQRDAVVARQVADADQLAVAGVVGKGQGLVVQHLQEAARAATVLKVGPAGLGHRRHVKASLRGDEVGFGLAQTIVEYVGACFEVPRIACTAAVALLRGFDRRREGDICEGVGHGRLSESAPLTQRRMTVTVAACGPQRNACARQVTVSRPARMVRRRRPRTWKSSPPRQDFIGMPRVQGPNGGERPLDSEADICSAMPERLSTSQRAD